MKIPSVNCIVYTKNIDFNWTNTSDVCDHEQSVFFLYLFLWRFDTCTMRWLNETDCVSNANVGLIDGFLLRFFTYRLWIQWIGTIGFSAKTRRTMCSYRTCSGIPVENSFIRNEQSELQRCKCAICIFIHLVRLVRTTWKFQVETLQFRNRWNMSLQRHVLTFL